MKSEVLIFHGTGGHPQENWFPWLKKELRKTGTEVIVPQFPNPEAPLLQPWLDELERYKDKINENAVLIGHSLGGLFLLRVLERIDRQARAAIFVGASVGVKPIQFYDGDNKFSDGFDFNWDKIRSSAKDFVVFHSDNDPYVSLGNGQKLASELGVELTFVPNAGHFNASAGYTRFSELLEDVNRILVL